MLDKFIIVYKKLGQTPLECLNEAKIEHREWANLPLTYAGRLDPMAEGLMIVLIGEECKNKEKYLKLDKTYEFQVLVGFSTDTHDLLGIVASSADTKILSTNFANLLPSFVGKFTQKYPSFSSKTVGGKQLFQLSKDNELTSELPEHEVTIKSLVCTKIETISKEDLEKEILRRIALVHGDFRQEEIINKWKEIFEKPSKEKYTIFSCITECSSGTYIRQLVADISGKLNAPLVTYSIKRTEIGEYKL